MRTPTPYRAGKYKTVIVADSAEGLTIGKSDAEVAYYGGNLIAESVSEENAEFIVKACNMHGMLVGALSDLYEELKLEGVGSGNAVDILAYAKGETDVMPEGFINT